MNGHLTWALVVAALLAIVLFTAAYGRWRWSSETAQLIERLDMRRVNPDPRVVDCRELEGLPPPVQRYFRAVLRDGAPIVGAVTIAHEGSFNLGETSERWTPFTSKQRVLTRRPGFVWNARMPIVPGVAVHVHDAYVAGEGLLRPAIAGLFTLTELRGGGEIAEGELMRFLAEAAWYPTALLPSQGVRWDAIDDTSARAHLVDGQNSATLSFEFNDEGLIAAVRADARGRTVAGKIVPTPWEGHWTDFQLRDGLRVPLRGEVAWLLPAGRKPYWRGTITSIAYEFAK